MTRVSQKQKTKTNIYAMSRSLTLMPRAPAAGLPPCVPLRSVFSMSSAAVAS